jgi:hypothetical protein
MEAIIAFSKENIFVYVTVTVTYESRLCVKYTGFERQLILLSPAA